MPDTELSGSDAEVAERMASELSNADLGIDDIEERPQGAEAEDVTEPSDVTEEVEAQTEEGEEGGEAKAQEPEDPEFEIVDPANPEAKQQLKLSELVQAHREYTAFKDQRESILQREEMRAQQATHQRLQQVEHWSQQAAVQLQAAMQLVQPPRPPDISMRDPRSPNYDPDRYEMEKFQFEGSMRQYEAAQRYAQQFSQQAEAIKAQRQAEIESVEADRLTKAWPEFYKPETMESFVRDMQKHYGLTFQELDDMLTDHRQVLAARDALAWRKSKAAGGELQARVVAKAPAKQVAPKGQKRELSRENAQHMQARKAMKESGGKDMSAAARAFMKYV